MKRIKDIALYSSLCYTFLMLFMLAMLSVASETLTRVDAVFSTSQFADIAFLLLVYSIFVGLSFLIFDVKAFNKALKRVLHISLNFALLITVMIMLASGRKVDTAMIVFASCFLFLIVYFLAMLVSKGINKLGELIDSRNN